MSASFTVTYCRNWDGGGQERDTAVQAVREVFPDATVTPKVLDSYPIQVQVDAHMGGTAVRIWEGSQKDLFRKNRDRRDRSIEAIKNSLMEFKEEVEE